MYAISLDELRGLYVVNEFSAFGFGFSVAANRLHVCYVAGICKSQNSCGRVGGESVVGKSNFRNWHFSADLKGHSDGPLLRVKRSLSWLYPYACF